MTVTPDRPKSFYNSEPYLAPEFCMLVRADKPFVKTQDRLSEVMEDICTRRSDAAFMTAPGGAAALLEKPGACQSVSLR